MIREHIGCLICGKEIHSPKYSWVITHKRKNYKEPFTFNNLSKITIRKKDWLTDVAPNNLYSNDCVQFFCTKRCAVVYMFNEKFDDKT